MNPSKNYETDSVALMKQHSTSSIKYNILKTRNNMILLVLFIPCIVSNYLYTPNYAQNNIVV